LIPAPNSGVLAHEARIDQLDVDAAVLHRLDRARDLDQLAGGGIRIDEGRGSANFKLIRLLAALGEASRIEASAGIPPFRPSGAGRLSKARRARSGSRSGSMCSTIRATSRQSAPSASASSRRM
jgi:hypothetical protein